MSKNKEKYYVDFSGHLNLTEKEKAELERIQRDYYPIERTEHLTDFYLEGKINDDEYEKMTTIQFYNITE